jgi:copper chaperone CopZ
MKSLLKTMVAIMVLLTSGELTAQIKNPKTTTAKIYGNCGMCKKTIEKAANIKDVATVDWNKDTKIATITFDSTLTSQDEILKRVANVGYDSETIKATTNSYEALPGCCQYERKK